MLHGGDYNPDQWLDYDGVIDEDFRLMELAGCNAMSIGIFSWMSIEPGEGLYNFEWLDNIMDRLAKAGKFAVLATPSGARPVWMSKKYPEVLRVNEDRTKNLHGERHNHCYTSPVYREKTEAMNRMLAERYKDHPALLVWHVSNEYGGECHCDLCQEAFREWLKEKYNNDINELNHAWWTTFWSHKYTDFSQIESPSSKGERSVHGLTIDWKRFVTYQTTDFMKNEMAPLKELTPDVPITTNFMGIYDGLDYWKMAGPLDVISWDSYPTWHDTDGDLVVGCATAFSHDINRSLKDGKPFMLMESTPSMTNWQAVSKLKRPGMHLLSSIQAIAHGADTVQYFQWRKSRGSFEKFHGAVVDHCGHEHTRVFRDVAEVGETLKKLDGVIGTSVKPEVAVIFDWENRWAIEEVKGYNNIAKNYAETVKKHYEAFWRRSIPVDVIDMDQAIDSYKVVIAPMLYMLKPDVADKIKAFVNAGGTFVATYMSGIVDETDLCFLGGFPGPLKEVMGIWVEETDGLYSGETNSIEMTMGSLKGKGYEAKDLCDLIHLEGADTLGAYTTDFYAGMPAVTVNDYGEGQAYYIGFRNNNDFEDDFYGQLIEVKGIKKAMPVTLPEGVVAQTRYDDTNRFYFVQNYTNTQMQIAIGEQSFMNVLTDTKVEQHITVKPYGVVVLRDI